MEKVGTTIALSTEVNETADLCDYICPDNHFAESWNDFQPKENQYSLAQPGIRNIFNTRQAQVSLLKWTGKNPDYLEYIKSYWKENLFKKDNKYLDFRQFWNRSLQDGIFSLKGKSASQPSIDNSFINKIVRKANRPEDNGLELHTFENVAVSSGRYANNPWLQELPDPISQVCWDNYAAISPSLAKKYGIKTNDVIKINDKVEIPALVQPGQSKQTISIALGYGRSKSGKVGQNLGVNVYPMLAFEGGHRTYTRNGLKIEKMGKMRQLANTQMHSSMEERDIVRSMTLEEFLHHPDGKHNGHEEGHHPKNVSLYKKHEYNGHHWGMLVDLSLCIGCNTCTIACNIENNIPVVGREEVKQAHEMHWIRIDRYYSGDEDNPEVLRQPLMCQQCDNAPCENVCPVEATTHSSEGINQMAYNRCIGTRYCNNNCPYKVRRFNWHDYNKADAMSGNTIDPANLTLDLPRMILNPDVTVRAKGVIEKCNFCIQRIQAGKLRAKSEGRKLRDDDIQTACQQACPSDAILFGDMNDPESKISKKLKNSRSYHLLEHLHTLPSVTYLNKVNNELV
jgi:molybdopterin-containing oxidoreductase family iron-sulfur binding subunit